MYQTADEQYMMRALQLAAKAGGKAAPNPLVGAVLVHQNKIIGEGYHQQYGEPHAEVNCFESVAAADKLLIPEATLYVTLEPCAHYGKTPPCALRIIQEGIGRVVVANRDPFAAVDGKGMALLREAGITVEMGVLAREAAWLNRRFFTLHTRKRPYIILKWAQTSSGLFAPADGSRKQISNRFTKRLNQQWRSKESAIMIGTRTALHDNPRLLDDEGSGPLRIVLDRNLKVPESHQLHEGSAPTWFVNELRSGTNGNVLYEQQVFDRQLLPRLCDRLWQLSCSSLIVEGGAVLLQSFLDLGLWDEIRIFETGDVLSEGLPAPRVDSLSPVQTFTIGDNALRYYLHPDQVPHPGIFALSSLPL